MSFVGNWMQPVLISSENSRKDLEIWDPCLDHRCWAVLKFCLDKSFISVSPNLLRAITRIARHALLGISGGSSSSREESSKLFEQVSEYLSVLLSSNSRAFYNAGVDLWISCAVEFVNLVHKVTANDKPGSSGHQVLLALSICLLEHFASFLRFYPNPKNIFRAFVDRLLDPSLELLVLLHSQGSGGKGEQVGSLLRIVGEVLSNGLFHPAHINGFLSLQSLKVKHEDTERRGLKGSYHQHFFQRFKGIKTENKAVLLGGFGYLFQLFVGRVRNRRGANMASKGTTNPALWRSSVSSEGAQETNKPLFEVFARFMEPLLLECKGCALPEYSEMGATRLVNTLCLLKSMNETLKTFIQERIYVRTDDTEGVHFKFLQEVHDTIISVAGEIYKFWLLQLHVNDTSIVKMLPLTAREVFVAVGCLLEIEYKVVGDDLVKLWLMMFAFLAVNISSKDAKLHSLLNSEVLNLGCQIINVFRELRQVGIFFYEHLLTTLSDFSMDFFSKEYWEGKFSYPNDASAHCLL